MDKKIPAIVVLAALTTEIVLGEYHEHSALAPQHVETEVKPPAVVVHKAKSSSAGGTAVSASGVLTSNDHSAPVQPHIEPPGSGPFPVVDFTLSQIS